MKMPRSFINNRGREKDADQQVKIIFMSALPE